MQQMSDTVSPKIERVQIRSPRADVHDYAASPYDSRANLQVVKGSSHKNTSQHPVSASRQQPSAYSARQQPARPNSAERPSQAASSAQRRDPSAPAASPNTQRGDFSASTASAASQRGDFSASAAASSTKHGDTSSSPSASQRRANPSSNGQKDNRKDSRTSSYKPVRGVVPRNPGISRTERIRRQIVMTATTVLSVIMVLGILYTPSQQLYLAIRENERLTDELERNKERNSALAEQVSYLTSQEGIQDEAHRLYGYVMPGENAVIVVGEGIDAAKPMPEIPEVERDSGRNTHTIATDILDKVFDAKTEYTSSSGTKAVTIRESTTGGDWVTSSVGAWSAASAAAPGEEPFVEADIYAEGEADYYVDPAYDEGYPYEDPSSYDWSADEGQPYEVDESAYYGEPESEYYGDPYAESYDGGSAETWQPEIPADDGWYPEENYGDPSVDAGYEGESWDGGDWYYDASADIVVDEGATW